MFRLNKVSRGVLLALCGAGLAATADAQDVAPNTSAQNTIAQNTTAQSTATSAPRKAKKLSKVVVTGARASENRTVSSSPTPIDVISDDTVKQANQRNLLETLNTALPSFNVPNLPGYGINSTVKAGQLRGLNSSHTLVLVNGKRRHNTARLGAGGFTASAPVDLGLIPTGSIERIEVLRDGASALYGSDAIAGVINIITRNDDEGGSLSVRYGEYSEGDGELKTYIARGGFKLGDEGHLHLSAQWDDQNPAFRDSPVPDNILFYFPRDAQGNPVVPTGNRSTGPTLPAGATPDPREALVDRDDVVFGASGGVPEGTLGTVTADLGFNLSDTTELYGFASYADRETRSPQHFRFPSRDQVVRAIWPDGFTPYTGVEEEDYSIQVGVKGKEFFGWDWDVSTVYGRDDLDTYQYDSNNPSFGLDSKTDFYNGSYKYDALVNNIDFRRAIEKDTLGILIDLSAGAEFRHETYKRSAGELQSWAYGPDIDPAKFASGQYGYVLDGPAAGTRISRSDAGPQADTGVRPEDTADDSRDSFAIYTGVSLYPTDAWVVDLAARYEDYNDFGDIVTGRLSSRYDVTSSIALRGTVSTGFQAPALAAQGYKATGVTVTDTNRTLAVTSAAAQALGAKSLEPEESTNYSIGTVIRPLDNLTIALDFYQIEVTDRISTLSTIRASQLAGDINDSNTARGRFADFVESADPSFGPNDGISYFINAGDTKTKGTDLTIEHLIETRGAGDFRLSAAGAWNRTSLEKKASTPAALTAFGFGSDLTYNAASIANLEYLAPRFKGILGLNWNLQDWSAGVIATRFGEVRRTTNVNVNGVSTPVIFDVGHLWLVDLEASYNFTDQIKLTLAGNNVFDKKPGKLPQDSTSLWPFQSYSYLGNSPVNAAGRFYSATLSYDW